MTFLEPLPAGTVAPSAITRLHRYLSPEFHIWCNEVVRDLPKIHVGAGPNDAVFTITSGPARVKWASALTQDLSNLTDISNVKLEFELNSEPKMNLSQTGDAI